MNGFPSAFDSQFKKRVAYFSMEYAIDQSLKIYSGGLGYLSGSHIKSAYALNQNFIAIGMLWTYGYYDQLKGNDGKMMVHYSPKHYDYLTDTGIILDVKIHGHIVYVKVLKLESEIFQTAPLYLLSTDFELNDYLSRTITHHLYDPEISTRIAQYIVLGDAGTKLVEILGGADYYHLNEAHALPCMFRLHKIYGGSKVWKEKVVFTTHTPEMAGNEVRDMNLLEEMNFFLDLNITEINQLKGDEYGHFNFTSFAIRNSRHTNAVSKLHSEVSHKMWNETPHGNEIIPITNAQNKNYWMDKIIEKAYIDKNLNLFSERKRELKEQLFKEVANQTGKLFDSGVFTMVWARRFAGYKRASLLLKDTERLKRLINNNKYPVQLIWAGKPYPKDQFGIEEFNKVLDFSKVCKGASVLFGYELNLSAQLKRGSDIWLNTPRIFREASGTSGMTAAMNGSINVSINDGWMPEFSKDKENCFLINTKHSDNTDEMDWNDCKTLFELLENEIIPMYYEEPEKWFKMVSNSIRDVIKDFDSNRMATDYYEKIYC
ncbi:MAG: alpha-glucan family phosphorylase [Cytophagales bacterium]